jgi:WG containing repeat
MLRYVVPTLLLLVFLTLPQGTDLDAWQNIDSTDTYHAWQYQEPDFAYPSLRMDLAKLDKSTLNQPFWSLFGQPRNYRYLTMTTSAQRVDFAVAYWRFINKQNVFSQSHSGGAFEVNSYRASEIPYQKCRDFAVSWWIKNSDLYDKTHKLTVGHLRDIDDPLLQETLQDAGELLYRTHVAGEPSVLCNDSPTFNDPQKYLPFLGTGAFIHQQFLIADGAEGTNLTQDLKERAVLTGDSLLCLANQTAQSLRKLCTSEVRTETQQRATVYSLANHQGQIALSICAPAVTNFRNGVAKIGLRLAAPVGSRETNEYESGDNHWTGAIDRNHKTTARTKYYDFRAIVDATGNWHYDVADYPDPQPRFYRPVSSTQSDDEYSYNRQAESYTIIYPSDSKLMPATSQSGYCGYDLFYLHAIPARFDWAGKFHQGLALVLKDGKFGYIDLSGKFIIPPTFEAAGSFSEGVAPALDSVSQKWGYIDKSGHFVIAPRFVAAYPFFAGLAVVGIGADEAVPPASPVNQSSLDLAYGREALHNSQAEVARRYFKKAIADDPHGPFAKQAQTFLTTRIPAKAIPFDAEVELRLACSDYTGQRTNLLKECIQKYPYFEWAYTALAKTYIDSNSSEYPQATQLLDQVRAINPNHLPALLLMSELNERNGHSMLASAELKAAKELNANDDLVRQALAAHGLSPGR